MRSVLHISLALLLLCLSAAFALFLGAVAVPWTTASASALVITYALSLIGLSLILAPTAVRRQRIGLVMLLGGQAFWFALPAVVLIAQDHWFGASYNFPVTPSKVVQAVSGLMVFSAVSLLGYLLTGNRPPPQKDWGGSRNSAVSGRIIIALLFLGLLPFFIYAEGLSAFVRGVLASRSEIKPWSHEMLSSNPIYVIGRASLVTAGLLSLHRALAQRHRRIWHGLSFLIAFLITYFDSGTRSWTLMILAPPLALAVAANIERSLRPRRIRALLAIPVIIALSQAQLAFREWGVADQVLSNTVERPLLQDSDFFTETAIAMSIVPDSLPYLHESTALIFVANVVPRELWASKPYPQVIEQYGIGKTGADEYASLGVTRLPSVVGQFHMTWGLWGIVVVALFYGASAALLERAWRRSPNSAYVRLAAGTAAVWLFLGFRALTPGLHYPVLILIACALLSRRSVRQALALAPLGNGDSRGRASGVDEAPQQQ